MQGGSSPITDWIKSDVKTANTVSIIMIIFAAWAGIEAVSNLAGIEIPPETGMATNIDPDDTQRTNNGVIVGLGAVLGTLGIVIQSLIPRGEEEPEERGPVFDDELVKLTKWLCSRGTTTAQFFDWADVDNSGSIDMVEFANALRAAELANLPPWEIEDLVKLMDINEDGRINLPELDIALLNIRTALGIEFVPYVEEEIPEDEVTEEPEEEVAEEPEEEVDQTTEDAESEDQAEDDSESETDGDDEESEDESTDDSEESDAESEDGPESPDEDEVADVETEEEAGDDSEPEIDGDDESEDDESTEQEKEVEEPNEDSEEDEVVEEAEDSEEDEVLDDSEADDSAEDEAAEEAEDSEEESDEDKSTEEVVQEPPKKKKKF